MHRPFNIRLWFALAAFGSIALIGASTSYWVADFMTRSLLERESEVSQEFFQSIVEVEGESLFRPEGGEALASFARHVVGTPGVMRANIYSADRRVIWSTELKIVGRSFNDNDELDKALQGERVTEINSVEHYKAEYFELGQTGLFIETYLPMRAAGDGRQVTGVVELYKFPTALNATITEGRRIIWAAGFGAAFLLFITLYWIVQRGATQIERQHKQLGRMQALALLGEMASAIATACATRWRPSARRPNCGAATCHRRRRTPPTK